MIRKQYIFALVFILKTITRYNFLMKSISVKPKFKDNTNSRIGLVALSTDFSIEKDFNSVFSNLSIDLFINRLPFYNPLTDENLVKMTEKLTEVTENILPNQTLDAVAYGCTSGTIAAGIDKIINKIQLAKPNCKVITPITSAVNALKYLSLKINYMKKKIHVY